MSYRVGRLLAALLLLVIGLAAPPAARAQSCTGIVCDDASPCTDDACIEGLGCTYVNDDTNTCNDGSTCTTGDACSAGSCVGTTVICTEDLNPCTTATCNAVSGCGFVNNTAPCDDGDLCTLNNVCSGGSCQTGTPKSCSDGNGCTDDSCNPATGDCEFANNEGACDDANPCTVGDACLLGACNPGPDVLSCDDENDCTDDACNPVSGCVATNDDTNGCDDGSACTTDDACSAGACTGTAVTCPDDSNPCTTATCDPTTGCSVTNNTASCDDGNACTLNDICSGGTCQAGAPKSCSDGNVCTDDSCNPATGACAFLNNTAACSDGDVCTVGDTCVNGACQPEGPLLCNDDNACTDDTCNPLSGCVATDDDTNACDDGSACTTDDACSAGACTGTAVTCPDDSNPCTTAACDPTTGCSVTNNTASCDDGNACTLNDVCAGGTCQAGISNNCDDGNPCTTDSCTQATGSCSHQNNTGPCSDSNTCTVDDRCEGGTCRAGGPLACVDGNPCTTDGVCVSETGCRFTFVSGACEDGNPCTEGDTCQQGICSGTRTTCPDDSNPCTLPVCSPTSGCGFTQASGFCDDGNPSTTDDVCIAGVCVGTPISGCSSTPRADCLTPKARGSALSLKNAADVRKDAISWRWAGGSPLAKAALGSPSTATDLRLCIYDQSAGSSTLVQAITMPAGGLCDSKPCWSETKNGLAYRDRGTGSGSIKMQFKAGSKPAFSLGGRGARLAMPPLPLTAEPRVIVQLQRSDVATCVEARYPHPGTQKTGSFKATSE